MSLLMPLSASISVPILYHVFLIKQFNCSEIVGKKINQNAMLPPLKYWSSVLTAQECSEESTEECTRDLYCLYS